MVLAILLIGASLTFFLWGAGGISYGDSGRSTPLKVTANAQFYPTFGSPNDALVTADDAHVLVSTWIVDANGYGKCFIVRAEEMLTAFVELERAIHEFAVNLIP